MKQSFTAIEEEKRNRIINAALIEFTSAGYAKASTNTIARNAGISKGAIFHYFDSKKKMFLELFEYCNKLIDEFLVEKVDWDNPDLLYRYEEIIHGKAALLDKYPAAMDFLLAANTDESIEIRQALRGQKEKASRDFASLIYKGINRRLFLDGIDVDKAIYTIQSTFESILHKSVCAQRLKKEEIIPEITNNLTFFRNSFYK